MKKMYFGLMSLAALAALTSCSSEDTVAQQKSPAALESELRFLPAVSANMRALTEYSTSTINQDGQEFRMIGTGNFSLLEDASNPAPSVEDVAGAANKITAFDCTVSYTGGQWNLANTIVPAGNSIY